MAPLRAASPVRTKEPSPPPAVVAPRDPTPPPVTVTPVVDVQVNLKMNEVSDEQREERLVAAMNEENDKMTASKMLADRTEKPDISENNNVPKVTVQIEAPATPVPVIENVKPVSKFIYKKEQWSPDNPTGRKQYDRDFIMLLQNEPQSKKRPENLPAIEVLRDGTQRGGSGGGGMRGSMPQHHRMGDIPLPNYMNKSSSLRGTGGPRDSNHLKRPSMQMGRQGGGKPLNKPMPIQVSLSLNEEVKLRECETPWKASRNVVNTEMTEDDKKTEVLYKKVRGVLNRLTPQKFQKLVAQVRALPIDTHERLEGVINLVFEKAVEEPGFSTSYAEMCRELGKLTVKDSSKDKNENDAKKDPSYRQLLVQRCQKEFEKNSEDELNRDERNKEIEAETNADKKKELMLLLEEDERKIRVKSVGNIRFIGELYKLQQLTAHIMFGCISHLISLNTEESLECLCKLLTTIGCNLENDIMRIRENLQQKISEGRSSGNKEEFMKNQQQLQVVPDFNKYFDELDKISRGKTKSSRVRFMIRDLIDLREAKWKPKRDEGPKTMDQIVKEAEREQFETNLALSASNLDNKRGGGGGRQDSRNSMDNRGGNSRRGQESNGGWTQVSTNARKQYVETSKLRVTHVEMDLGMSLGSRDTFIWNKSSANKSEERKLPVSGFNKFAVLEETQPIARASSLKGSQPSGPAESRPLRPSPPDERSFRSNTPLRPEAGPSASRDALSEPAKPRNASPAPVDPEQFERSVHLLVDEFITNEFYEEASKTLAEKVAQSMMSDMAYNVFLHTLEKSVQYRRGASRLFAHFLQTAAMSSSQFFSGLKNFLSECDDLVVDIPKLWEYLGEILADVVSGGLGLAPVLDALRPPSSGFNRTIVSILRVLADLPGVSSCRAPLQTYLGGEQPYLDFIKHFQLGMLEKEQVPRPMNEQLLTTELTRLLRSNAPYETITRWVEFHVGPACTDVAFIRVLTNALLDVCLTPIENTGYKLDQDVFKRHGKLLLRYIDFTPERELQCLFTIQLKMAALDHPKGVLSELCNQMLEGFCDCFVISANSFKKWRDSKDPQYVVGRGVCVTSLNTFFTVMDAGDDMEDNEEMS